MNIKFTFFLVLLVFVFSAAYAQAPAGYKAKLTDDSVVKDSMGTIYPASIWKKLLSTGQYTIRAENPKEERSEFYLVRLSEQEQKRRMENAPPPRESSFFRTGSTIANFTEKDINGNKYKLKDLVGKVVVINFWFINCAPCRQEIPELNKIVSDYKDSSDVVFLGLCLDDKYSIKEFLKEKPFSYNIVENTRYISNMYGVTSYPTHVVLDKQGKVVFHTTGFGLSTVPWLRKSIAQALH